MPVRPFVLRLAAQTGCKQQLRGSERSNGLVRDLGNPPILAMKALTLARRHENYFPGQSI